MDLTSRIVDHPNCMVAKEASKGRASTHRRGVRVADGGRLRYRVGQPKRELLSVSGVELRQCLRVKGFCVINNAVSEQPALRACLRCPVSVRCLLQSALRNTAA